jgi:hypothetical protein
MGNGNNVVRVTFIGAADAQFTQDLPINGGSVQISMFIDLCLSRVDIN